ncbi:MAG: M23 family metallopeptidase [Polyangiaceae bacterium]
MGLDERSGVAITVFGISCMLLSCSAGDDGTSSETGGSNAGGSTSSGGVSSAGWTGSGGSSGGASGSAGAAGSAGSAGSGGGSAGSASGGSGSGGNPSGGTGGTASNPVCLASQSGAYCGNDMMKDADPNTLYQCPGANKAPSSATPCPNGCVVEVQGVADHCKTVTSPGGYKLPWKAGVSMQLTQDCNDACCSDHINDDGYAWDFANGTAFTIVAARGGTVTHLKINSTSGCGSSSCVNDANFIVIDHGDGTQSTYLHLGGMTLSGGVSCGASVSQGQSLAKAGTTGWSTGLHLHFQVSKVHAGAGTCECGSAGTGCAANSVPWGSFWSSPTYPTVPIQFEEWPAASSCNNRRITMPASQN